MATYTTEVPSPVAAPGPAPGASRWRDGARPASLRPDRRDRRSSLPEDAFEVAEPLPEWRARWFDGGALSPPRLATMSGPLIALVVGLMYLALASAVAWTGDLSETAAGFWPPAGVALAAMLLLPVRRWGWVALAIVVPNGALVVSGVPPTTAAVWALANCVEAGLAAAVLRRFRTSRWLTPGRLLVLFLTIAVIGAPAIAGVIGTLGTIHAYDRTWSSVWLEWVAGDGLGILVTVPLLVTYTTRRPEPRNAVESAVLLGLLVSTVSLSFLNLGADGTTLLPYLILVLLIWAGMRFGTTVAAFVGFVVGVSANIASLSGHGPFAAVDGRAQALTLQIFLAIAIVTSFVVSALAGDLANRTEVNRLLHDQATHDSLTGLPNRVLFHRHLRHALRTREGTGAVAVILVDLEDFKKINDRHGHPIGDEVLEAVADRLQRAVRRDDVLCRLAGDEFVVLCTGLPDPPPAAAIASGILGAFDGAIAVAGMQFKLGVNIGIATAGEGDATTAADVLRQAEIALHRSKQTDGVRISSFDDELEARTRRHTELADELQQAIGRHELAVHYQPVVDLHTGTVRSVEALLRWSNRRFGAVGPDEFIPIAEGAGLIRELGDWVLAAACRDAVTWRAHSTTPDVRVAVNVSAHQVGDDAFPERVRRTLEATTLPPAALILEITETAVVDDLDRAVLVLAELRRIGVQLSMDDFGTGYSSMTYLRHIPVNTLKIDRSFVAGLGNAREDSVIVESLINLGHGFDLEVVAEGIETSEQLAHLVRLGCDHGQGFLWSRAVDAPAVGRLMRSSLAHGAGPTSAAATTEPVRTTSDTRPPLARPQETRVTHARPSAVSGPDGPASR